MIAGGYANGSILTWELAKPAKPFMRVPPISLDNPQGRTGDGHVVNTGVLHLGFLGARRTALASADGRGMAFSHLAARGLGAINRAISTTRILGRYPNDVASGGRPRKPSSVLAFSALPLGNVEQATDTMGLVAMLTPYLLVIVSTMPIAQTQHKAGRPKDIAPHGALSGCLAWFPSVRLKAAENAASEATSRAKLVYCWSDVLTVGDLTEVEAPEAANVERPPILSFRSRNRWKAGESIVAVQWLSRSILALLTITQQLVILEDYTMTVTTQVDLLNKQIMHHDHFSRHLHSLVEQLEENVEEDASLHGVVADAFSTSFRVYKGRIFLLGSNDVFVGAMSSWTDRLTALLDDGRFVDAIRLATHYFLGDMDTLTVGLPKDEATRRSVVQGKLLDILSSSLRNAFPENSDDGRKRLDLLVVKDLCGACFDACTTMADFDFLFDEVYEYYEQNSRADIFLDNLGAYITQGRITSVPPLVVKGLVEYFLAKGAGDQLEEIICLMDTATMDIDQMTTLCKQHRLYDALLYIWNQAFGDYITPLVDLMSFLILAEDSASRSSEVASVQSLQTTNALKIFPYLSYVLTGRSYPTGNAMTDENSLEAKSQLYSLLFAGSTIVWPKVGGKPILTQPNAEPEPAFPYLRLLLHFDAASFLSAMNEAFEDPFLNGIPDAQGSSLQAVNPHDTHLSSQKMNRQHIISILWEVLYTEDFSSEQTIYLDMFVARNLPKFPQFILLSGTSLHRVLVDLCNYPSKDIAEDCQLSVEYLFSMYRPADLDGLIPSFKRAGFYRVLKSIYKVQKQYAALLQQYFDDWDDQSEVFFYLEDFLRQQGKPKERQLQEVKRVVVSHAAELVSLDTVRTAEILDRYAPEWHESFLGSPEINPRDRFVYLQAILEPQSPVHLDAAPTPRRPKQAFVEEYVRLMCQYDSAHVADYVGSLQAGHLRLEQVLPEMENEGVIDAAVVIVAREGEIRDAMDRLLRHLGLLEGALLGLLEDATDGDGHADMGRAIQEILDKLQKYSRVGIWLCQRQMKSMQLVETRKKQLPRRPSAIDGDLSLGEMLWLDLIDATVRVVKSAMALLGSSAGEEANLQSPVSAKPPVDSEGITKALRSLVQETFTALLSSTTSGVVVRQGDRAPPQTTPQPTPSSTRRLDLSFLRILRAFLARASMTSSSLSELRAVLTSIFSAYIYEESVLSLSNKLLQDDLFVYMEEVTKLRQRGWRPKSQLCEGCGKRVWGPGAGGKVWEAWRMKSAERRDNARSASDNTRPRSEPERSTVKGKGVEKGQGLGKGSVPSEPRNDHTEQPGTTTGATRSDDTRLNPLVVFNCGHVYHQACFDRLSRDVATTSGADGDKERRRQEGSSVDKPGASLITSRDSASVGAERSNAAVLGGASPGRKEVRCAVCSR